MTSSAKKGLVGQSMPLSELMFDDHLALSRASTKAEARDSRSVDSPTTYCMPQLMRGITERLETDEEVASRRFRSSLVTAWSKAVLSCLSRTSVLALCFSRSLAT